MNRRILLLLLAFPLAILPGCGNGIDKIPGSSPAGGALSVQFTQLPNPILAGQPVGLVANVLNDTKNGGVTWSCTPVGACGTFNPTTTGYNVDTQYTPPVIATINLPVQITATSVTQSSQSVTAPVVLYAGPSYLRGQYAFVLGAGNGSFGMVGSVTLDGNGNIVGGEADASANGFYSTVPSITGTYTLDSTGHGSISMSLNKTSCCGTLQQTHGITATSSSHLVIAEEDQFNGLTIGAPGSMDLQTAGPGFIASQVSGGYSFTLSGYSHAHGANASWGGIFSADGVGALLSGVFDENFGGGTGYSTVPFTGTFTGPDANGRGTLTFSATPDTPGATQYAYYLVTPEVMRITSVTNTGNAGNTGSAYGQGAVTTTNGALTGNFIFSDFGFTSDANGGESGAAAGQFTTDGGGNITAGTMDLNAFGTVTNNSLAGSTYSISGSPRGTITAASGQTYNVYLTDPNLNLLDPNNSSGTGGALLLETDAADTIGIVIPQTDAAASPAGAYATLLSDQDNPPGSDGGFTGDFTVSSTNPGTFSGEGDFQGCCSKNANATLTTGPLSGTFAPDGANLGRFTATITTTPCYPFYVPNSASPTPCGSVFNGSTQAPEQVSLYIANGSQGFIVETDSIAPAFGVIEAQTGVSMAAQKRQRSLQQGRSSNSSSNLSSKPVSSTTQHSEISRRSR